MSLKAAVPTSQKRVDFNQNFNLLCVQTDLFQCSKKDRHNLQKETSCFHRTACVAGFIKQILLTRIPVFAKSREIQTWRPFKMTYPGEKTYILSCPVVTLGSKSDWMVKLESQLEACGCWYLHETSCVDIIWHLIRRLIGLRLTIFVSAFWFWCFFSRKAGFFGGAQKKWKREGKLSESYQLPGICLHFVVLIAHKKRHILLSNLLQPSVQIVMTALSFPKIEKSPGKRKKRDISSSNHHFVFGSVASRTFFPSRLMFKLLFTNCFVPRDPGSPNVKWWARGV